MVTVLRKEVLLFCSACMRRTRHEGDVCTQCSRVRVTKETR